MAEKILVHYACGWTMNFLELPIPGLDSTQNQPPHPPGLWKACLNALAGTGNGAAHRTCSRPHLEVPSPGEYTETSRRKSPSVYESFAA